MESDKYPKATFKGVITNLTTINFAKDGEYKAEVKGKLSIHGVTRDVTYQGKVIIRGGKVLLNSLFNLLLADYNISIPAAVKDKLAKEVKVNVNAVLEKLN